MIIQLSYNNREYKCNLKKPIDISIPTGQVKCFFAPDFEASPYISGEFIGSVKEGAPINFFNVFFNPHGNGTHTECMGHITKEQESINNHLLDFHFIAHLCSVEIEVEENGDSIISLASIKAVCPESLPPALLIRTLPNNSNKLSYDYSGTNPAYLKKEAMEYLVNCGVEHILIDLPSVDREEDEGVLAAHHIFWNITNGSVKNNPRKNCTITEMIYVDSIISDGLYLLNIQIAPFSLDATPSKPILYELINNNG